MASVQVAVRVRPLNKREKQLSSKVIIRMKDNTTSLLQTKDGVKTFSFDFSYDSTDGASPNFASQEKIFQDLGIDVLSAAFQGFNACVFAYGQTGSGKSYTMMGDEGDKGLIPRICEGLFDEISARNDSNAMSFRTEVSYLEIYNERVLDLLNKSKASVPTGGLRVREHPRDGPYVENLSKHVVHSYGALKALMTTGNGNRTTASTGMNDVSSRSHAIFTVTFTQAQFESELPCEMLSKIHLVDLAGSERADATCATGTRLKEGANINKSLVTLGSVISALADMSDKLTAKKQTFIPYRDSVLTWLLKDSLGGNSKTIMIAAISPADVNYGETLSTLRYANRATNIVNSPTVNEDASVKMIRELQAEISRLRGLLEQANQVPFPRSSTSVVEERLQQSETKVLELTQEWTSKWLETENILKEETLALSKKGNGVVLDSRLPHLIGVDKDLLSTGIIIFRLKEGSTLVGSAETACPQDIVLGGPGLWSEHCVLENSAGTVSLIPRGHAPCFVNGTEVTQPCQLNQGAVIQLGKGTIFRFNNPAEASQLRQERKVDAEQKKSILLPTGQNGQLSSLNLSMTDLSKSTENLAKLMLLNSSRSAELTRTTVEEQCEREARVQEIPRMHSTPRRLPRVSEPRGHPQHRCEEEEEEGRRGKRDAVTREHAEEVKPNGVNGHVGAVDLSDAFQSPVVLPSEKRLPLQMKDAHDSSEREDVLASVNAESLLPSNAVHFTSAEMHHSVATPGKCHVSHAMSGLAEAALLGGVSARDGQEQEGDSSHKSGLGFMSATLQRGAEIGTGVKSCGGTEPRSGDARLLQTSVLGPGDGCGMEPEGVANKSQGVVADMGHPSSGGSSLGRTSHLQSNGEARRRSVLPQASAYSQLSKNTHNRQASRCPPGDAALEGKFSCGEIDESRDLEGIPEVDEPEALAVVKQHSGLMSLVSRISWMFPDARGLLGRLPGVPWVIEKQWSGQVVSLIRRSQMLNAVKTSQVFSLITESYAFSLVKESHAFSVVNGFPLIQHLQVELEQGSCAEGTATAEQNPISPDPEVDSPPAKNGIMELSQNPSSADEEGRVCSTSDLMFKKLEMVNIQLEEEQSVTSEVIYAEPRSFRAQATFTTVEEDPHTTAEQSSIMTLGSLENLVTVQSTEGVKVIVQKLVPFPEALMELQSMALPDLVESLGSLIPNSVFTSQRTVALYWLAVAKCSQPQSHPALLILLEAGLYAVTCDAGSLVVFHHFPLRQLKEVHVGLAGQSLRLMGGPTEETVLGLHTHSQRLTQEVCHSMLGVLCPGDGRVSQHPLLHGDLQSIALDWQAYVPDLLLDAGLKVCCQFQKTLADLVYFLHCNMPPDRPSVGEVQLLLYTSVRVCTSPNTRREPLAYLLLTETHLGLVQEDTVFHPPPRHITLKPHRSQFQDIALRSRLDVRCMLVHDAEGSGGTRVDIILAYRGVKGHPESGTALAIQLPEPSKSSPQAEVWKLTFSCAAEAACLINHLSNV